jgi:hypothetical protein
MMQQMSDSGSYLREERMWLRRAFRSLSEKKHMIIRNIRDFLFSVKRCLMVKQPDIGSVSATSGGQTPLLRHSTHSTRFCGRCATRGIFKIGDTIHAMPRNCHLL